MFHLLIFLNSITIMYKISTVENIQRKASMHFYLFIIVLMLFHADSSKNGV